MVLVALVVTMEQGVSSPLAKGTIVFACLVSLIPERMMIRPGTNKPMSPKPTTTPTSPTSPSSVASTQVEESSIPTQSIDSKEDESQPSPDTNKSTITNASQVLYRKSELRYIKGILLAGSSVLVLGESGSGKSFLARNLAAELTREGFLVIFVTLPASPTRFLKTFGEQLGMPTKSLEGKKLVVAEIEDRVADRISELESLGTPPIIIIDAGERMTQRQRQWLKLLIEEPKHQPCAVFASEFDQTDLYLAIAGDLKLDPLPEYAIRDLLEKAAMDKGIDLSPGEFAKLQAQAQGSPGRAIRAVRSEYTGLSNEGGNSKVRDLTPFLGLLVVVFAIQRFMALGSGNPLAYVAAASMFSIALSLLKFVQRIPKQSRKVKG